LPRLSNPLRWGLEPSRWNSRSVRSTNRGRAATMTNTQARTCQMQQLKRGGVSGHGNGSHPVRHAVASCCRSPRPLVTISHASGSAIFTRVLTADLVQTPAPDGCSLPRPRATNYVRWYRSRRDENAHDEITQLAIVAHHALAWHGRGCSLSHAAAYGSGGVFNGGMHVLRRWCSWRCREAISRDLRELGPRGKRRLRMLRKHQPDLGAVPRVLSHLVGTNCIGRRQGARSLRHWG